jgi:quercetin dioxygenase-like cupin family protein
VVLGGRLEFHIGENATFQAGPGDVVFTPRDTPHRMETVGDEPAIRLAIKAPEFQTDPA